MATAEDRFITMVNTYRALGYRMVCFERECEGGFLMAFDTHGKDATEFPRKAFDNEWVRDWCAWLGWDLYSDEVRVLDDTDDPWFLISAYDYDAEFPVMQLTETKED